MSVTVTYGATVTAVETLPNNTASAPDSTRKVTHTNFNQATTLNSGSTPPAQACAGFVETLSGGAATINLRTLLGTNGANVDGNGWYPQVILVENLGANPLTIKQGAANGHNAFGSTDGVTIPPGAHAMFFTNSGTHVIDDTHKTWDLTGTGSQQSQWMIILG
jgi:hypothetical protein